MKHFLLFIALLIGCLPASFGQDYTSYFTGNANDTTTAPSGGICLMGGATEDDNAMIWWLQRANGGDVLVLRASGSDGYNNYLYNDLGVGVNSVETIVFNNAAAASDAYIHQKIQQAEAIWFAGGDQWNYVNYWRNNAIDSLINDAITNRNVTIGGTSAGMAIQGGFYFSAQNGTVTSGTALANPYDANVTVDSTSFINNPYLSDVITDTHYDDPDRKGRHLVFLGRILVDYGIAAKGIACDEYTAVCIDPNGLAKVYGGYPTYDDNAYFIQTNCALSDVMPENCSAGNAFDWNLGNEAIKVYEVKGTSTGANTFDLSDWKTGSGGEWENWYVANGVFNETAGLQPDCSPPSNVSSHQSQAFQLYPNPAGEYVHIAFDNADSYPKSIKIINTLGHIEKEVRINNSPEIQLNLLSMPPGLYLVEITHQNNRKVVEKLVIH